MDSAAEATESTALLPGSDGVPSVPLSRWERFKRIRGSPAASLAVATLALFTDAFCYGAVVPYQPTYERLYNLSDASLGLVMGSYAFVMTPFTPIAGILSDRFGRTIPFTGGVVALAAATFLFAFAPNLILLVLARCMQGLAGACTWASALAIVDDNYKGESHGTATGFAMMGFAVGMMSSPPIAGVMLQYVGYITPFMFAVGLCVVDTLLRLICMVGKPSDTGAEDLLIEAAPDPTSINAPTPPATPTKSKPGSAATTAKKTVRQQLSALFTSPVVVPLLILNFISAFSVSCMEVIYPLHMAHAMDASPGQIGGVFGAVNVSFGLFSWIGGIICDRVGRAPVLVLSLIGLAGTMMGISFPTNIWMAAGIGVALGALAGIGSTAAMPIMSDVGAAAGIGGGMVFGVWNGVYGAGMAIGPAVGGLMVAKMTFRWATIFLAGVIFCGVMPAAVVFCWRFCKTAYTDTLEHTAETSII